MRLAHLHIPNLIPYTYSLQLQNALLERHFAYKSVVRSFNPPNATSGTLLVTKESRQWASVSEEENVQMCRTAQLGTPLKGEGKAKTSNGTHTTLMSGIDSGPRPPDPVVLTFSTPPTYTVGRRHLASNPISPEQQTFLSSDGLATFHASPRGGLLTYHAPGQLTGYVIADLRRHGITARCWVKLLEESVMRTCAAWGVQTTRTDDPGVWIKETGDDDLSMHVDSAGRDHLDERAPERSSRVHRRDRKICAIGVQVSRGVTSHGIGLNVCDAALRSPQPIPLEISSSEPSSSLLSPSSPGAYEFTSAQMESPSYDAVTHGYLSWGFSRIVACGLEGKSVTWLTRELPRPQASASSASSISSSPSPSTASRGIDNARNAQLWSPIPLESVADVLAREVCCGLNSMKAAGKEGVDGVYQIQESDILPER